MALRNQMFTFTKIKAARLEQAIKTMQEILIIFDNWSPSQEFSAKEHWCAENFFPYHIYILKQAYAESLDDQTFPASLKNKAESLLDRGLIIQTELISNIASKILEENHQQMTPDADSIKFSIVRDYESFDKDVYDVEIKSASLEQKSTFGFTYQEITTYNIMRITAQRDNYTVAFKTQDFDHITLLNLKYTINSIPLKFELTPDQYLKEAMTNMQKTLSGFKQWIPGLDFTPTQQWLAEHFFPEHLYILKDACAQFTKDKTSPADFKQKEVESLIHRGLLIQTEIAKRVGINLFLEDLENMLPNDIPSSLVNIIQYQLKPVKSTDKDDLFNFQIHIPAIEEKNPISTTKDIFQILVDKSGCSGLLTRYLDVSNFEEQEHNDTSERYEQENQEIEKDLPSPSRPRPH